MRIIVKNVLVEAYHFIGLVAHYYSPFCQIYSIIILELPRIKSKLVLQMSFKALNDLVRPNGLVPILLIFGVYFCITNINVSLSIITQCSITMQKAIKEVRKSYVSC